MYDVSDAGKEYERKFLVSKDAWLEARRRGDVVIVEAHAISQHYLPDTAADSLRLRLEVRRGALWIVGSVKGKEVGSSLIEPRRNGEFWLTNIAIFAQNDGSVLIGPTIEGRVRFSEGKCFLTLKKETSSVEERYELEAEIPKELADAFALFCSNGVFKTRYVVEDQGVRWEVDEYEGNNAGLVAAEVEGRQYFSLPGWIGREVTGDRRFSNRSLAGTQAQD